MSEFNVGDKVYVPVSTNDQWAGEGVVTAEANQYGTVILKMTTGKLANSTGGFYENELILVERAPQDEWEVVMVSAPYTNKKAAESFAKAASSSTWSAYVRKVQKLGRGE